MSELRAEGKHEAMWVTISTDEYESMKAAIEALSDAETMEQIRKSEADIKAGKTKKWDEFVHDFKKKC